MTGKRTPTTEIASDLTVLIDFSFLIHIIFRIIAIIDGIIPTKKKEAIPANMDNINAMAIICMKFPLIFCAHFTKIVSI